MGMKKTMGERLSGRGHNRGETYDDNCGSLREHASRSRAIPAVVLLIAGAIGIMSLARDHAVGSLLGPGSADASAAAAAADPLTPTQLVALPGRRIANGTQPLTVTLSAPSSASSPQPTLRPAVAGAWAAVGDSEVFTPVSTLSPARPIR